MLSFCREQVIRYQYHSPALYLYCYYLFAIQGNTGRKIKYAHHLGLDDKLPYKVPLIV